MNTGMYKVALGLLAGLGTMSYADIHYVDASWSHQPVPPYLSWAAAARDIQSAVTVASDGDSILVADGTYAMDQTSGFTLPPEGNPGGSYTAIQRYVVGITKNIRISSVNGPAKTIIDAQRQGGGVYFAVPYATQPPSLVGFTVKNGFNKTIPMLMGGGIRSKAYNPKPEANNCVLVGNEAYSGGGACFIVLNRCTVSENAANEHGGVFKCTLNNCTVSGNTAKYAGGAGYSFLDKCLLFANSAGYAGGGAASSTLTNCTVTGNTAEWGGGVEESTLNNCTVSGNTAASMGGGLLDSILRNCVVSSNTAPSGGGVANSTLYTCTVSGNTASAGGGGAFDSTLNNCTMSGNNSGVTGGGAYECDLFNCLLISNSASWYGGGAFKCNMYNCTVVNNTADHGGGGSYDDGYSYPVDGESYPVDMVNCIVWGNHSALSNSVENIRIGGKGNIRYSCSDPKPIGAGNIKADPLFAGIGDKYRLKTTSPCRNAGLNITYDYPYDLGGATRIMGGIIDMGCYEITQ